MKKTLKNLFKITLVLVVVFVFGYFVYVLRQL